MAIRSYNSLEPSLSQSLGLDNYPLSFSTANPVSLLATTSFLYSLAIMVSVVAAGFIYARAGLWRMQASEAGVRKSNEEIKRATLGLLGVLSLFVILYTFNKGLLSGEVGLKDLRTSGYSSGGGGNFGGGGATGETPTPQPQVGQSESMNRATLSAAGITFNKDPCVGSSTSCTNVGGINPSTISMLLKLRSSCACNIQITGGTEPGHSKNSNHGIGKEAVDISLSLPLLTFLKNNGTPVGSNRYGWGGFVFWNEAAGSDSSGNSNSADHFHVSFTGN